MGVNVEEKEKVEDHSSDIPTVEQLLDEVDKQNSAVQHTQESPFDTESEILFVKSFHASHITKDAKVTLIRSRPMNMDSQTVDFEFKLESMPDDNLQSLSGFETSISNSIHDLPGLLSDALKNSLPQLLKESLTPLIPSVSESVAEEQAQLNKRVVKHMNRQFNIAHKAESLRFVTLQKALTKVLKTEMVDSISSKVRLGMQDVREDLISQTKHLSKYCLSVQDMHSQLQEVRRTLEAAVIMNDHAEGEKSKEGQMDENANPATTQGEHSNVKENVAIPAAS
ncbi:hypothetical protein Tco_0341723 [Tanacetum coccineum]